MIRTLDLTVENLSAYATEQAELLETRLIDDDVFNPMGKTALDGLIASARENGESEAPLAERITDTFCAASENPVCTTSRLISGKYPKTNAQRNPRKLLLQGVMEAMHFISKSCASDPKWVEKVNKPTPNNATDVDSVSVAELSAAKEIAV